MKKQFLWKDKTGKGETATLDLDRILAYEDEESYDGDSLHEWAQDAAIGDTFESATFIYTCTNA